MKPRLLPLALIAATLTACAGLGGPSSAELAALPVVDYGRPAPAGDFVLRYPAGVDLPVVARVDGNLFAKTDEATLKVRLKRDVYTFRDRASFDGKDWQSGHSLIAGQIVFALPGDKDGQRDAQSPGQLSLRFDAK